MNSAPCLLRIKNVKALTLCLRAIAPTAALFRSPHARSPFMHSCSVQHSLRSLHGTGALLKIQPIDKDYGGKSGHEGDRDKSLVTHDELFERVARMSRTKATFNRVLDAFVKQDVRRRGHVEFIYAALKKMPEFGVERDIAVYNKLLDIFPKEVFVPRNFIQRMYNHYPRQQECGLEVLEQMENHGLMPNVETKVLLVQIFGVKSHPVRKYQRLMYWFPRFKNLNPYPVPHQLSQDPIELARFSLSRIAADLDAKVTVYQLPYTDVIESGEEVSQPYIVGIQSPDQRSLLAQHCTNRPVFVEGPFPLWLRKTCIYYYVLRADPLPPEEKLDLDLERDMGDDDSFDVDEVEEGPVFAMCMVGRGDQATLGQWISALQETNPVLGRTATLFRLESGPRELQSAAEPEPAPETEAEPGPTEEEEPLRSHGAKQ
ncbi:evolutionarily conserved signaling intermediate in Toll pathway, mitochondrial isoform X2 [Conger conger]|uniref:evolutionarily conserved signaling intermediate in Toll pathway, mitochondrial isoform X2 n=1 Tax=Conger conger TaxID=82655 RepID=UPI002A5AA8D8|nr:evolutionarily conserved signaling intermediate in Toll pathway, mitochondrial isoform X2 [Conger conger]